MSCKISGLMSGLTLAACVTAALFALPAQAAPLQAYVGTYTPDPLTFKDNHGDGIYLLDIDPATGLPGAPKLVAKTESPGWIALSADHRFLYAANEYEGFGPKKSGAVTAYAVDAASGALKKINTVSSQGGGPCYVSIHASGKFLLIANYMGGTFAVVRILPNGSLGEASDVIKSLPRNNPRQAADSQRGQLAYSDHDSSRAHMIASDPTGRFVIGNDAGRDTINVWTLDAGTGKLTEISRTATAPGSAPRHFAFSSDGKRLYQLFEQNSRLGVYDFNDGKPVLRGKTQSLLPENYAGSALASEVLLTKDGKYIYAANRTQDSIAVFTVATDGNIRRVANVPTAGNHPRSLTIDPSGKFLYSLNQRGDHIATFRLDPATGIPRFTGHYAPVASPAVMVFR